VDWDIYSFFYVLSGLMLIGVALYPEFEAGERAKSAFAAVIFIGVGLYETTQTSGTFFYTPLAFAVPFFVIYYVGKKVYDKRRNEGGE
jgi:hypothetical protein